ncbi:MAG TPA: hypothetical protein VKJ65_09075 [Phycisphaerae bacterium]|nr:hypothetical protein [Phycisphaerae bacterium]
MYQGNKQNKRIDNHRFWFEECLRDLVIRKDDCLVDWVEAKMCFTDCLAREKLAKLGCKRRRKGELRYWIYEYFEALKEDAKEQQKRFKKLLKKEKNRPRNLPVRLTLLLFAVHHYKPLDPDKVNPFSNKYSNRFNDRDHYKLDQSAILKEARRHVDMKIKPALKREGYNRVQKFKIQLGNDCELHVFAFYKSIPAGGHPPK